MVLYPSEAGLWLLNSPPTFLHVSCFHSPPPATDSNFPSPDTVHDVVSSPHCLLSPRHWPIKTVCATDVDEIKFPDFAPTPPFRFHPQAQLNSEETLQTPRLPEWSHPDRFRSQSLAGRVLEDGLKFFHTHHPLGSRSMSSEK